MDMNTLFRKTIYDKLTEKGAAESTKKNYIRNLEKINEDEPLKNFNFLEDQTNVLKFLDKFTENTKRNYLIAITSVLELFKDKNEYKQMYSEYKKLLDDINKKLKTQEGLHVKTAKQEKNWLTSEQINDVLESLKKEVDKFKDKKEINQAKYNRLLQYVILSLYMYQAPRRNADYQYLNLISNLDPDSLPDDINYLDFSNDEFIFNKFKTSKHYGQQVVEVSDKMGSVILIYLKFHPLLKGKNLLKGKINVPFLVKHDGESLKSPNSITYILNNAFDRDEFGNKKKIGSTMLRHIFLSNVDISKMKNLGDVVDLQKKLANEMGHSVAQQGDYIKKD